MNFTTKKERLSIERLSFFAIFEVMKKTKIVLSLAALCVLFGALAWNWLRDNKLPNFEKSSEFYVRPGETLDEAIAAIDGKCGIISRKSLDRTFKSKDVASYMKPGHYYINRSSSSVYVARMLNNGWQSPVKLTLAGNLRIRENIAAKIASQMLLDSATVRAAFEDKELLARFGSNPRDVFSLMVPATYEIWWTASMEEIFAKQKEALDAFWTPENDAKAARLGMTRQQVSTLASIVKGETNYEPEMAKVAGVYLNRLKIGMPLQADPTVAFCFDYKPNRILNRHLEFDSPYNTYKYPGLPPGPICVPTKECLLAVLNADYGAGAGPGAGEPGAGGNLYFCANADFSGTHAFAKTLAQHNANASAFQKELSRRAAAQKNK